VFQSSEVYIVLYSIYHRTVRVVIRRYKSAVIIIPNFISFISSLQNLHTLQIFHVINKITPAIRDGLQGVVLPEIRTLIIPGHCHEILKSCPQVTKVWCNNGNGTKLVGVIAKYCKQVQEMRGFKADTKLAKSALNI
jgi:hypothetical protein